MTASPRPKRQEVCVWALVVFACSLIYRFLSAEFTNDDLLFLAQGRQIAVFGEWPIRDLLDEGRPLHYFASAAAQALLGYRFLGEMLLDLLLLSAAYALTFLLAADISRSIGIGLLMAGGAILASPRLYDYPKAILPVAALWLCFRYLARPTTKGAVGLGVFTAFAFLYRHDFGVYAGLTCAAAILGSQVSRRNYSPRAMAAFGAAAAASLLPFLVFLEINGGVIGYVDSLRRFGQREMARTGGPPPALAFDFSRGLWEVDWPPAPAGTPVGIRWAADLSDASRRALEGTYRLDAGKQVEGRTWEYMLQDPSSSNVAALLRDPRVEDTNNIDRSAAQLAEPTLRERLFRLAPPVPRIELAPGVFTRGNAVAWLYYLYRALPLMALALLTVRRVQQRPQMTDAEVPKVLMTVALCGVAAPLLLRGDLAQSDRLADIVCPSAILGAWVVAASLGRHGSGPVSKSPGRQIIRAVSLTALLVTFVSLFSIGRVARRLEISGLFSGPAELGQQILAQYRVLVATPPSSDWIAPGTGGRDIVRYVRDCTQPTDRVFVTGFHPELFFFSGRGFAGDRAFVLPGFWTQPWEQQRTVETMKRQSVPLAIVDATGGDDIGFARGLPLIQEHISASYHQVGTFGFGASSGVLYNVWAEKARPPVNTYQPLGLPCYR